RRPRRDGAFSEKARDALAQRQQAVGAAVALGQSALAGLADRSEIADVGALHPRRWRTAVADADLVTFLQLFAQQPDAVDRLDPRGLGDVGALGPVLRDVEAGAGAALDL